MRKEFTSTVCMLHSRTGHMDDLSTHYSKDIPAQGRRGKVNKSMGILLQLSSFIFGT